MAVYASALHKMDALREFQQRMTESGVIGWDDELRTILDTPVADTPRPEDDPSEVRLNVLPEDMCVWVVLPGQTAVMLASDGAVTVPPGYQPSQRDRAIIRALLQTATRENEEAGRPEGVQLPYGTPMPYPSGGF